MRVVPDLAVTKSVAEETREDPMLKVKFVSKQNLKQYPKFVTWVLFANNPSGIDARLRQ